jgi:hypothetical protein
MPSFAWRPSACRNSKRSKKEKFKNAGVIWVAAIIEGKKYELIRRSENRYFRGGRLRCVDRGRHGSRLAEATDFFAIKAMTGAEVHGDSLRRCEVC